MKLTNTIRDAFIRAAMNDVPQIDYQEKTIKVVLDDAISQLPIKVRAIYKDGELSSFIRHRNKYFGCAYVAIPAKDDDFELTGAAKKLVSQFDIASDLQGKNHAELSKKLRAVAYSVGTRKALADALPDFEKYLPADEAAACKTLPCIANVVTDFVKAGWPKGTKKAAQKAA